MTANGDGSMTGAQRRQVVEEILLEENPEAILFDGLDTALVGVACQYTKPVLAVYDRDHLIRALMEQGMDREEAVEYLSFNIEGLWAGEHTPLILDSVAMAR